LQQAFINGEDIHRATAAQIFGVPYAQVDDTLRRNAKAINFGIVYGISAFGLSKQLGVPRHVAGQYIKDYLERFKELADYMERTKEFARANGYVETLFGRKCFIDGINDKNGARKKFGERQAINAPTQGTGADIIKRAMILTYNALKDAGLKTKILLQVHDELVLEASENELEQVLALVKENMEKASLGKLSIPLPVDIAYAKSWDEC